MLKPLLLLVAAGTLFAGSCSEGDSAIEPDATRASAGASPQATLPRVDGTVDPLGFGGTETVTVKSNPDPISKIAVQRDVRVGAHPEEGGWDRIVFEFVDVLPAATIGYVPVATQCGSGQNVRLPGAAVLLVRFEPAAAHDDNGRPTIRSLELPGPGGVIVHSRLICDFEAHLDWAIGLRRQERFKVTRLSNPTRLVIDVKQ
jgi:hypothetical protein